MKKLMFSLITIVFLIPMVVMAKDPVKVYVFEAGGCPACEAEYEYLEGLPSYKEKFEIIKKELYVDHVKWAQGKDYNLGVSVVDAFTKAGFKNSESKPLVVTSTPLVIVSDIYAENGANTDDLDKIIDQAYEEGDKDAVSCIEAGGTNCVRAYSETHKVETEPTNWTAIIILIIVLLVILALVILAKIFMDKREEKEE